MRDGGCPGCLPARSGRRPGLPGRERGVHKDALEPDDAVHPFTFGRCLALQLESELDEERRRGRYVTHA